MLASFKIIFYPKINISLRGERRADFSQNFLNVRWKIGEVEKDSPTFSFSSSRSLVLLLRLEHIRVVDRAAFPRAKKSTTNIRSALFVSQTLHRQLCFFWIPLLLDASFLQLEECQFPMIVTHVHDWIVSRYGISY